MASRRDMVPILRLPALDRVTLAQRCTHVQDRFCGILWTTFFFYSQGASTYHASSVRDTQLCNYDTVHPENQAWG